jgi:hypothetical protein
MGLKDELFKVGIPEQEIPVNPSPHPFYLTKDPRVYNRMMRAIYKCMQACAEAHRVMYEELNSYIPKR